MAELLKKNKKKKRRIEEELEDEEEFLLEDDEDFEDEDEDEEEAPKKKKGKKGTAKAVNTKIIFDIVNKLQDIREEMSEFLYEREEVLDDMFRALIAGENLLILGPPGTGKSFLAQLFVRHVVLSRFFKWLFNKNTDPSDVIGPYSVKGMENDEFRRITDGRLADAHFAFLDEFKLGLLA